MARAANLQVLTNEVKAEYPGVIIYGIGDKAHQGSPSGHNEDDTKGSRPELEDTDNRPEHRAIDIMLGKAFSKSDADRLVDRLLADPRIRARLYYIIWNGYIWSRSSGWKKTKYNGKDKHTNHIHISGWAADDENTASWFRGSGGGSPDMFTCFCAAGDSGPNAKTVQYLLWNLGYKKQMPSGVDGKWGGETTAALRQAMADFGITGHKGDKYGPEEAIRISIMWVRQYAPKAPAGPPGKDGKDGAPGKDGRDGVLVLPEKVTVEAVIQQP